jgi:nucleotide-binding universal stress UspA family protein
LRQIKVRLGVASDKEAAPRRNTTAWHGRTALHPESTMNVATQPRTAELASSASPLPTLGVVLDRDSTIAHVGGLAVELAARFRAHLAATYVIPPLDGPRYSGGLTLDAVCREARTRAAARAHDARCALEKLADERGVAIEWRCLTGDPTDLAILSARYADLTILEAGARHDPAAPSSVYPETVVVGAGRPVIVVPRHAGPVTPGQRILVAWNGSLEATRAVAGAMPLLAKAKEVAVLTIRPETGASDLNCHGGEPGADLALYLARHGVRVEVMVSSGLSAESDGACLFREAETWAADLVVMGAFGHCRLRELIFGGVTQHALERARIPVLLSA